MDISLLISIIVPVYNTEKYLSQCIESLIKQTYKNIEIIIVNDGSTDNSLKLLKKFSEIDSRIILLDQLNKGLADARNYGIKVCKGDYIMFVDSDDWINTGTCNQLIEILNQNKKLDLIFWSYYKEYDNESKRVEKYILPKNNFIHKNACFELRRRLFGLTGSELKDPSDADTLVTAWGKLYCSSYIKNNQIQFVDTKIINTEDLLFNIQYFKHISEVYYLNHCLYHYRKTNTSSLTSNFKPGLFNQWQTLYKMIETIIIEEKLESDFYTALNNRKALSIIGLGLNIVASDFSLKSMILEIKKILLSPNYVHAYSLLTFKFFPFHWKVFFFFAKHQNALGVYILLKFIQRFIKK